jgi:hypothetical protein
VETNTPPSANSNLNIKGGGGLVDKEEEGMHIVLILHFSEIVTGWKTVHGLNEGVKNPKYSRFLVENFLSGTGGATYGPNDTIQLELIGLGALALRGRNIEVPSPLHHTILLKSITSKRLCVLDSIPVSDDMLDVPKLVRCVWVSCFNCLCFAHGLL